MNTLFSCSGSHRGVLLLIVCAVGAATFAPEATAQDACEATHSGMNAAASDNTAAFKKILTDCAGKTIHIAHGTYMFSPNGFDNGMLVPSNTNIIGDGSVGESQTVMRIADSGTFASFLWIRDTSNISIRGIRFEGTPYESGCFRHLDYGHAVTVYSSAGSPGSIENIRITEDVFSRFNGQSWITMNAQDRSPGIGLHSEIVVSKNGFFTEGVRGSCAGSGNIGRSVYVVSLHGSDDSNQGMIENVSIASNSFHVEYVEAAVAVWSDTGRISIQNNEILNAGLRLAPTPGKEQGRYAIAVYNSAHEKPGQWPDTISIVGNTITNPVSCGVYVASARNLEISHNKISGQSDAYDITLPKGAIALNHAMNVRSEDNDLVNNRIGVSVVVSDVKVMQNRITVPNGGIRSKIFRDEHSPAAIER